MRLAWGRNEAGRRTDTSCDLAICDIYAKLHAIIIKAAVLRFHRCSDRSFVSPSAISVGLNYQDALL